MRVVLFILIELILCPVSILGLILFMGVILLINRPRGISGTAYEPFMNRLLFDDIGTREDNAAKTLSTKLPATHPLIWSMVMGPTRLAARISGYWPRIFEYPPSRPASVMSMMAARTRFFDSTLDDALASVQQVVILGAGWDTRSWALPNDWAGTVFEVDAPATQAAKRKAIEKAGLDASHICFVAVNFNTTPWVGALKENGFDPGLPTHLLWEGVTMYLDEAAISDTLRSTAQLAEGSRIAFDYFAEEMVKGQKPYSVLGRLIHIAMWLTYGDRIVSGIPMHPSPQERVAAFVSKHGLELVDFDAVSSWYGFALARRPISRINPVESEA